MTDDEFVATLEDCTLSKESFHHADHVRMAYLYLSRYSALEALQRFSTSLARFAVSIGKADRYHETITWAFLLIIRERMARSDHQQTWPEFASANADLLNWKDKDNVLKKFYREETLASPLAKTTFVFPDKIN